MCIKIFITGGTFDKEYNEIKQVLYFKNSHVPEMLKHGRCKVDIDIRTLMMIDSFDMTDTDRKNILENCRKCEETRIVITHGTDGMPATAKLLAKHIKNKTIILTGAMVPYTFGSSDGMFNLGSAIAYAEALPKGVFIAMNGKYFKGDKVRKNLKTGEFEET